MIFCFMIAEIFQRCSFVMFALMRLLNIFSMNAYPPSASHSSGVKAPLSSKYPRIAREKYSLRGRVRSYVSHSPFLPGVVITVVNGSDR